MKMFLVTSFELNESKQRTLLCSSKLIQRNAPWTSLQSQWIIHVSYYPVSNYLQKKKWSKALTWTFSGSIGAFRKIIKISLMKLLCSTLFTVLIWDLMFFLGYFLCERRRYFVSDLISQKDVSINMIEVFLRSKLTAELDSHTKGFDDLNWLWRKTKLDKWKELKLTSKLEKREWKVVLLWDESFYSELNITSNN